MTKKLSRKEALDILRTHVKNDFMFGTPHSGLERVIRWLENQ